MVSDRIKTLNGLAGILYALAGLFTIIVAGRPIIDSILARKPIDSFDASLLVLGVILVFGGYLVGRGKLAHPDPDLVPYFAVSWLISSILILVGALVLLVLS